MKIRTTVHIQLKIHDIAPVARPIFVSRLNLVCVDCMLYSQVIIIASNLSVQLYYDVTTNTIHKRTGIARKELITPRERRHVKSV